jgi:polysaccharide chain length determinant protein (PEP-CTERM system associated)
MAEDFEIQNSSELNLQYLVGVARRRHLHFLIPLFIGWVAVWTVSWILPPRYKSTTLILVAQPTMPKDYVKPNVNDDLQDRLQNITQQILSRTRLLHIINELNLYREAKTEDEKVDEMRKGISIDLVREADKVTAFNIYYSSYDPRVAQQVTSELTNLFINENLEVRQQQSEGTTKFLEDQMEAARKSLSEQEEKIREFKGQHVGELPTQLGSNLQILSGLQSQLQADNDALNTAKQQHAYLQTLLSQYRALQGPTKGPAGAPMGLPAIDAELEKLRSQLADLGSRYTDQHPDVRKLKDQIAKTEKMRDQLIADLKNKPQSDDSATQTVADPSQSAPLAQLQGQLRANQIEIENRERSIDQLKAKVNDYQVRLNQEPVAEQQLADLTRGYDQSKANYDDLLKKRNESAMATSMELLQQGEHFSILDPPSLPNKPDFPNRLKFCGMGLGVGLALGVLVAGAFEMMDDRLYDEKQITDLLPVTVLSEIPDVHNPLDEQRIRKRLWLGWATTGIVTGVILVGSAISYLRG